MYLISLYGEQVNVQRVRWVVVLFTRYLSKHVLSLKLG